MASRILGMGDVLTLIERAEAAVAEDEQAEMEKRLRQGQFTFDDFLKAHKMLRRMGPLKGIMKMIPGLGQQLGDLDVDERQLGARRGDRALDDAARARAADRDRREAAAADRPRLRHDRRAGQPAARGPQADGEDDEADGAGKMPALPTQQAPGSGPPRAEAVVEAQDRRPDGGKGSRWLSS